MAKGVVKAKPLRIVLLYIAYTERRQTVEGEQGEESRLRYISRSGVEYDAALQKSTVERYSEKGLLTCQGWTAQAYCKGVQQAL